MCTPAQLYYAIAAYYHDFPRDLKTAEAFYLRGLQVASQSISDTAKVDLLHGLGMVEWTHGNYPRALQLAQETYKIGCAFGNIKGELNGI